MPTALARTLSGFGPGRAVLAPERMAKQLATLATEHAGTHSTFAVLAVRLARAGAPEFDFEPRIEAAMRDAAMARIARLLRRHDRIGPLAHDEFIVILPQVAGPEHAELAAARILSAFEDTVTLNGVPYHLRPTIGAAVWSPEIAQPTDLVRHARVAARAAETKRSRFHVHQSHGRSMSVSQPLDEALRLALSQNALTLDYQPQIRLDDRRPIAAEVLARWRGPDGRPVSPAVFVDIAERRGMLAQLTRWVLNAALREHATLREAGTAVGIGINISPIDLDEEDFPALLADALAMWSVPPGLVTLEITETAPLRDPAGVLPVLSRLKDVGVRLSIDDFGTGYSSLSLLRQLPVDELKIDQQFVRGMLGSKASMDIVRTTLSLAGHFGLDTVAEGIEDEATLVELAGMGCVTGQGYGICRPTDLAGLVDWLRPRLPQAPADTTGA
jgi:EAL domain-containing protein (putative c-di-GMP-specific phosphodiesterase class I)